MGGRLRCVAYMRAAIRIRIRILFRIRIKYPDSGQGGI
jgi:hypothetical protein